jgi:hypothetical protein
MLLAPPSRCRARLRFTFLHCKARRIPEPVSRFMGRIIFSGCVERLKPESAFRMLGSPADVSEFVITTREGRGITKKIDRCMCAKGLS